MISNGLLLSMVNSALDLLYSKEYPLIKNSVYEVAIVSKFEKYFEIIKDKMISNVNDLSTDIEYNKDILSEEQYKSIIYENKIIMIRPDFIFHKRESNDYNTLIIEFKKSENRSDRDSDIRKLEALTKQDGIYRYQLGLFIELTKTRKK